MLKILPVALLLVAPGSTWALEPDEVAIVSVRRSAQSRELAEYYARQRKIPKSHICQIDVEPGKNLSRDDWERNVRPEIRNWIDAQGLEGKLRVLVTTWDVPLKIDRDARTAEARTKYLIGERKLRIELLNQIAARLDEHAERQGDDRTKFTESDDVQKIGTELQDAFKAARERFIGNEGSDAGRRAGNEMGQLLLQSVGLAGHTDALANQQKQTPENDALTRQLHQQQGRLQGLQEAAAALLALPESVVRDEQILSVAGRTSGLLGGVRWIDEQLALLTRDESYAAFDSELSLLYWPDHPRLRWLPNVLHHQFDPTGVSRRKPVLMVSRLEAPTFELAKGLIDTAIEIERTGLNGKVYIDARGLAEPEANENRPRGSYDEYDQALRNLADVLKQHTELDVTLDNAGELFQPGDCPDAALYCGWYSLSKYVDAFDWNRGAVAWHIASGEAATLRDPNSNVWCKRMLEDGVCATLGPVYEPYLGAFPRPDEFFPVLLTGKYTLVETYYRTNPSNSWVMVLIGDPLYNPFGQHPALQVGDLPENLRKIVEPQPQQ